MTRDTAEQGGCGGLFYGMFGLTWSPDHVRAVPCAAWVRDRGSVCLTPRGNAGEVGTGSSPPLPLVLRLSGNDPETLMTSGLF